MFRRFLFRSMNQAILPTAILLGVLSHAPRVLAQSASIDNTSFGGFAAAQITDGGEQGNELAFQEDLVGSMFSAGVAASYTVPITNDTALANTGAEAGTTTGVGHLFVTANAAVQGEAQSFDVNGNGFGAPIDFLPDASANGNYFFNIPPGPQFTPVAQYVFGLTFGDTRNYGPLAGPGASAGNTSANVTVNTGQIFTIISIGGQSQTFAGLRSAFILPLDVDPLESFRLESTISGTVGGAQVVPDGPPATEVYFASASVSAFDASGLVDFDTNGAVGFGDADFLSGLGADPTQGGITDASFGLLLGDFNTDGVINTLDMTILVETHGGSVIGDVSGNGSVGGEDYTIIVNNWGTGTVYSQGDLTADGAVNANDYTIWANNFGRSASPLPDGPASAIPEPSSLLLLGVGLFGMVIAGRSRRRR